MTLHITSAFDGGNIIVRDAKDNANIRLAIRPDNNSDFFQWFYYRVSGGKGQALKMVMENAKDAAFTGGWEGYRACASYDRETWFRIDGTSYVEGELIIEHTPEHDSVYYAYFAPYPMERHADIVAEAALQDDVSMALREKATFHIIPNMCPDGGKNGNLRTNETGANLNREWGVATLQSAPEVYHTIKAMDAAKPDLCLDVHGDEALPYNFIAGAEGIPGYTQKQADNLAAFLSAYKIASPEFQTEHGYALTAPGKGNLTMCTNYTAHAYDCLAMTLEMPFKDNANAPDAEFGWSPDRSADLGAAVLDAMLAVIEKL